jgi:hypothetical protein
MRWADRKGKGRGRGGGGGVGEEENGEIGKYE